MHRPYGGKLRSSHALVDLPAPAAERGLAVGVVLPFDDPRVHLVPDHFGVAGVKTHGPTLAPLPLAECINLDEPAGEPIEEATA